MHRFQPTRASPPIKFTPLGNSTRSEHSTIVASELQNLSAEDIDILEAVIQRAGPSATTFFNIFKAYSDVLKERGLDPQEVVYYGKLLKLGTLKGKSWGEKWEIVKAQAECAPATPTLGCFQSNSDVLQRLESASNVSEDHHLPTPRKPVLKDPRIPASGAAKNHQPLSNFRQTAIARTVEKTSTSQPKFRTDAKVPQIRSILGATKPTLYPSSSITSDEDGGDSSPVPPSYKSTNIDVTITQPSRPLLSQPQIPNVERKIPAVNTEAKKIVDLDDAWKNIKLEQDEQFADKYREDVIIARCWEMWRQGFLWITTTHQQIGEARDKLLLEQFMHRWLNRVASRRAREDEVVSQFQKHGVKRFFKIWQSRLKQKRQTAWRNDMRQKMKLIKNKSETRIKQDAWATWRQLQLSRHAARHYQMGLLVRHHSRWKARLVQLDSLDIVADHFSEEVHISLLRRFWDRWKQTNSLRHDEHILVHRVDCRIMANAFDVWRKRISQTRASDTFRQKLVIKLAIQKWKEARNVLRAIESRAEKHLVRQDEILLRAIIRIWRARMRGKRLENFRSSLVIRDAWHNWKARIARQNSRIDDAAIFFNRTNSCLVSDTLLRWRQVLTTHQNAYAYATAYDKAHLRSKIMLLWRMRLRDSLQSVKVARWANKFFSTRRAWHVWVAAMEERKRHEKLKLWNLSRAQNLFNVWRHRARQQQYFKQCESIVQERVEKRILFITLAHWTNRVIELKSRELDVARQQDISLQRAAFQKWKTCRRQHVEEVSLLENYLLVKQEDILRRAFQRWLTAKRSAEHRRVTHQRKEAHLRQMTITNAWERWRESFKEERLRPLEYEVIIQSQKHMMLRAFGVWLKKTESLPAVRFHSKHLKDKFFKRWRDAMPKALRAKKARETDRYNTLAKYFEKWVQAYKTKITLKAVARAKYLRLPAAPSRQPIIRSRPLYSGRDQAFPQRIPREDNESEVGDESVVEPLKEAFVPRASTAKSPGASSNRSAPHSEYRTSVARQPNPSPSPVRSIVTMPDRPASPTKSGSTGGGRLWTALRDLGHTRRPRI